MQLFRPGTALHLFTHLMKSTLCRQIRNSSDQRGPKPATWMLVLGMLAAVAIQFAKPAVADEPYGEFIEGLRQRRYFDTALEYLDELKQRPDVPQDIKDTLDLERGITYREMGTASRIPEDRDQALTAAEQALKAFTAAHSNHPRAAYANFELGQLLLEKARSLLWDSESPSNAGRKADMQQQARTLVEQAKGIYQKAHDQYEAKHKSYPTFIDQAEEPELYQERQDVFVKYLRSAFNLARCTYERGQSFDKGTKERNETLTRAAEEFLAIHEANRTNPIGRLSRLMQGKCFQEQDDIPRALGLYNEIKDDDSEHPTMMMLKSYAIQFRLICLNHESRNDHQIVINEATAWLENKLNRSRLYSEQGLGILWEKAIAEEKLAQNREIDAKQKSAILRQAMADAKQVARFPSPYREPAVAMGRRINAELGETDEEPKDFDTAFERGRGMITQLKGLNEDLSAAKTPDEKQKAQQAIDSQLNEVGRMFRIALALRSPESDPKAVAQARYLLSYVFLRQRKNFDAIILAKYCMTRDKVNDPDSALSATEIAIGAAVQAYNDAGDKQEYELTLLKEICELIVTEYAQSSKGNEARMRLGQVYRDLNQPIEAAQSYLTVPSDFSGYPSARMQAGQSYWLAWVKTMSAKEDGVQPEQDDAAIAAWKTDATKLLTEGIDLAKAKLGENGKPTDEMVAAEVSLATILNMDGQFNETVKRLTAGGENSTLSALQVSEGAQRPEKGITSAAFASQAYRLMLRAYIGTQQVDNALVTMDQLESVGGQDMAAVYTELGRELQEELKRLKTTGEEEKLTATRQQFEAFLEKVYERRDSSDYNSLLWIGETYFGLGQGVIDDPIAAPEYFQKANQAYEEILTNNLVDGPTVPAIKLRIIRCKRAQRLYDEGVKLAESVLTESPLSLDVQFEAAYTLADWGADTDAGQPDKLLTSIDGIKNTEDKLIVWGWKGITTRLQARQNSDDWEDLRDRFLEAKYEYINSRVRYAATGAPDGDKHLKSALAEIMVLVQVFNDNIDDVWFAKFGKMYQDVQTAQNVAEVLPLERPEKIEIPPEELVASSDDESAAADDKAKAEENATAPEPEGSNMILIAVAVLLAAGVGFACYKVMSKPPKRPKTLSVPKEAMIPPPSTGGIGVAESDDGVPDFSSLGDIVAPPAGPGVLAPAQQKKKAVRRSPDGSAPRKKKRSLTPEEAAKQRAARAQGDGGQQSAERRKKVARKKASPGGEATPGESVQPGKQAPRKSAKKRQPPPQS